MLNRQLTDGETIFRVNKICELDPSIKNEIIEMLIECFPDNPNYKNSVYTNPDLEMCVLAYNNELLVGHVGITKRNVYHEGRDYLVGGIGDVAVVKEVREKGLGKEIMIKTNQLLKKEGYDLGLLFCHPDLDKFYSKCGWKKKEKGKIYAFRHGKNEDQRRTFYFPLMLDENEISVWNTQDIQIGKGSW